MKQNRQLEEQPVPWKAGDKVQVKLSDPGAKHRTERWYAATVRTVDPPGGIKGCIIELWQDVGGESSVFCAHGELHELGTVANVTIHLTPGVTTNTAQLTLGEGIISRELAARLNAPTPGFATGGTITQRAGDGTDEIPAILDRGCHYQRPPEIFYGPGEEE